VLTSARTSRAVRTGRKRATYASANDSIIANVCVITSTRRSRHRSTSTPANGASRNVGNCPANPTIPNQNGEPVTRYTSQLVATLVSQLPIIEISWPKKNRR
jgi:hypothetical protein